MASISPLRFLKPGREENFRGRISVAMREIELHLKELDHLKLRLSERRQRLFDLTVRALGVREKSKATVYANEHSELRKVIKVVEGSQLALTQVTLRLQSMTDIGDAIAHMNSAFKVMREVSKAIQGVVPALDAASREINSTLTETMAEMGQLSPTLSINVNTDSSEDLIEEAKKYAEEQAEGLKQDLELTPARFQQLASASVTTPLLADGEGSYDDGSILGVVYSSPRDAKIDDEVFRFAQANNGAVDVVAASSVLGIPPDDVEHSMLKLIAEGKARLSSGGKTE